MWLVKTDESGFVVAGWIRTPTANDDLSLIRLDSLGATLWTTLIGGSGRDRGFSVKQTTDGGFVMAGETASAGITGSRVPSGAYIYRLRSSRGTVSRLMMVVRCGHDDPRADSAVWTNP